MRTRATTSSSMLTTTIVLLVLAIGGRFTLDRAGLEELAWVDLRLLGLGLGLGLVVYERTRGHRAGPGVARRDGWLVAALLLFLFQISSGLWAPPGARVGEQALDISIMAVLTWAFYSHACRDPLVVVRRTLWFLVVTGVLFALSALLISGPGAQGRFAALGGGPNVFVRIQVLAIIAAVALLLTGASRVLLATLPLFLMAAVLSGSRGGLLAAVIVAVVAVALGGTTARRLAVPAALAFGLVIGVTAGVAPAVSDLLQTRFVEQTGEQVYTSGRLQIWGGAVTLAMLRPLAGAGLDGYYGAIGARLDIEHPHNYLLAVLGEAGLVGLLLLATAVTLWVRLLHHNSWGGLEAQAMVTCASYVATASLFSGHYYDARLAWLFAAAAAAVAIVPTSGRVGSGSPAGGQRAQVGYGGADAEA